MTCVCFQCGMVNHRSNTHVITVRNVTRQRDCRAYRVFRYYIRRLQRKETRPSAVVQVEERACLVGDRLGEGGSHEYRYEYRTSRRVLHDNTEIEDRELGLHRVV
jgi:hypothetical protein